MQMREISYVINNIAAIEE